MMTPDAFLVRYPEFRTASPALVQAVLDEATGELSVSVYGAKFDTAVGIKAAHLLAISPFGRPLRLVKEDGKTVYEERLAELSGQVAQRMIVI